MTPTEQDILRASLEKTCDAFFRKRAANKAKIKILMADGLAPAPQIDATGLLVVLSSWVGDLIKGAPEHMQDHLFMAFADSAATIAGIKTEIEGEPAETLQ